MTQTEKISIIVIIISSIVWKSTLDGISTPFSSSFYEPRCGSEYCTEGGFDLTSIVTAFLLIYAPEIGLSLFLLSKDKKRRWLMLAFIALLGFQYVSSTFYQEIFSYFQSK